MLNRRFKQWKGPSKSFTKDYEIFADLRLKHYLRLRCCWFYSTKTESTTQREIKLVLQTFWLLGCILCVWWVYVYVGARGPLETLNIYTTVSRSLQCWTAWAGNEPLQSFTITEKALFLADTKIKTLCYVNQLVPCDLCVVASISPWNWKFKLCEGSFPALVGGPVNCDVCPRKRSGVCPILIITSQWVSNSNIINNSGASHTAAVTWTSWNVGIHTNQAGKIRHYMTLFKYVFPIFPDFSSIEKCMSLFVISAARALSVRLLTSLWSYERLSVNANGN